MTTKTKHQNLRLTKGQHTQNVTEFLTLFNTLERFLAEKADKAFEPDPTNNYRTFMTNVGDLKKKQDSSAGSRSINWALTET